MLRADTVGVHLRTWRVLGSERGFHRACLFDRRHCYRILDRIPESPIFAVSDSLEELQALKRRYGDRVLLPDRRSALVETASAEGMMDALTELLLLSRAASLVVPWLSDVLARQRGGWADVDPLWQLFRP